MTLQEVSRGVRWPASSEPCLMSRLLNASSLQTHTASTHQTASEPIFPAKAVLNMLCSCAACSCAACHRSPDLEMCCIADVSKSCEWLFPHKLLHWLDISTIRMSR